MTVEQTTPNQGYQLPYQGNNILDDVARLRAALVAIDEDVAGLLSLVVAKAGLNAPNFTGTPTAETPLPGDNSLKLANTGWVVDAINALALLPSIGQIMANKTMLTSNVFADADDDTKKLALVISAITASVTRTLTIPDEDLNLGALGPHLAFRRGNVLGSVSQVGGVPTGALVERGSNSNGRYVRYADGTQLCVHRPASGLASDSSANNVFRTASAAAWTFPAAFASGSFPQVNASPAGGGRWSTASATSNTAGEYRHYSHVTMASLIDTDLSAIGRWF